MATLASGLVATLTLSPRATTIVNVLSTNLIVNTIATSVSSIYQIINYLVQTKSANTNDILNVITEIDLEFTINIIEELINEHQNEELHESIKKTLCAINEILEQIHEILNSVRHAIDVHNSKYLNGWRKFYWDGDIETIKKYNSILKHRYSILFELLKIYS